MLVTIVILFVLCWLPIHIHTFIVWFYPIEFHEFQHYILFVLSFFICHWLAMAHSFLNPIIYGFMSENFKVKLRIEIFAFLILRIKKNAFFSIIIEIIF